MDHTPDTDGLVIRCMNCRNRIGIDGARIMLDRRVCCCRCARNVQVLSIPGHGQIEIVG